MWVIRCSVFYLYGDIDTSPSDSDIDTRSPNATVSIELLKFSNVPRYITDIRANAKRSASP